MNRVFSLSLTAAALGFVLGAAFGLRHGSLTAFIQLFALITLVGTLTAGIVFGRHAAETPDGYVGMGDTFLAVGSLVVVVECLLFTFGGDFLALVYGGLALALTLFALKQERQVALAVSGVMSLLVLTWVATDSSANVLGAVPGLLWVFASGAYVASLASGEEVGGPVSA